MARWKALWLLAKMARVRVPKRLNPPRPRSFREIYTRIFFKLRETVQKEPRRRRQRRRSFNLYPVETQELFDSSMFEMSRKEERGRERGGEREREREERRSFENPPFLRIYLFKGTRSTSIMRQIHLYQLLRSYRDKCASSADIVERISSFL